MKNEDLREKYDEVFKAGSDNFFTCNVFHEAHTIAGMDNWKNKRVMDVGCGEGILPVMIAHAGAEHVVGVDYSEEAIKNAQDKFNCESVQFIADDYREVEGKFDVITMQGVMEHLDQPWDELQNMLEHHVVDNGCLITSSPSFINPRGYVWMTLKKLFDVPMSLTDLHFICPFDMEEFCTKHNYKLDYTSIHQDWGSGDTMIRDFKKRLVNALNDANMDNSKVEDLLEWMYKANKYFNPSAATGAIVVYRISKK